MERELKKLSKRHSSIKDDIRHTITSLIENPTIGEPLGNNCFEVRMAISSKNRTKSGGARIITYLKIADEIIFLLSIYDKSDAETISDKEILIRLKDL